MKGRKKAVVICLAAMLYCAVTGQQAYASAASQDGLKVELTKNQESYGKEERIEATLTVTNTNMDPVTNVLLEEFIPEGYQAAKGSSTTRSAESLEKGESITLTVVCIPEEPGNPGRPVDPDGNDAEAGGGKEPDIVGSQTQHTGNPAMLAPLSAGPDAAGNNGLLAGRDAETFHAEKNDETGLKVSVSGAAGTGFQEKVPSAADRGDVGAIIGEDREAAAENASGTAAIMLALMGSGLVLAAVLAGMKKRGRLLSLFLCTALAGSLIMHADVNAGTAGIKGQAGTITISDRIKVDGNEITLSAKVTYDYVPMGEEVPEPDKEKVPDYVENYFGTDPSKEDTDGDGLSDYMEIYILATNPLLKDTDGNGTEDAMEDADSDGLSNLSEALSKTDPTKADSDSDGLNDGDEINRYGTDPLQSDTDGDGISDGNEILLGLDPLKQSTDGRTRDSERTFDQTLSLASIDEKLLKESNEVKPSVTGAVSDHIDQHVTVESVNLNALDGNRAVVGDSVAIVTDYDEGSGLKLQFDCSSVSDRKKFLLICSYQDGQVVPCETSVSGNSIMCDASSGYYFVADAEKLLDGLGISMEKYCSVKPEAAVYTAQGGSSNEVSGEWYSDHYILTDEDGNPMEGNSLKDETADAEADETAESKNEEEKVFIAGKEENEPSAEEDKEEKAAEAPETEEKPSAGEDKEEKAAEAPETEEKPSAEEDGEEKAAEAPETEEKPLAEEDGEEKAAEASETETEPSASESGVKDTETVIMPEETEQDKSESAVKAEDEAEAADEKDKAEKDGENPENEKLTETDIIPENTQYVLADSLRLASDSNAAEGYQRREVSGQADIVFVIDSTGSMSSAINNVVKNIDTFVDTLATNYSVQANFALIDFKDITCMEETKLIKNGNSNWFTDVDSFKSKVGSIYVTGGGDTPETPIDGLAMAKELDFRQNADKFVILITDTYFKDDNHYGISSMQEMTEKFSEAGIVASVISSLECETNYYNLYNATGGVFGDIYGDFYKVLLDLADNIGHIVNDGSWVILSDFQYLKLKAPVSAENGADTDGDGVTDYVELGTAATLDLTEYLKKILSAYGVPFELYEGETSITTYRYISNPILVDTDYDGKNDDTDVEPLDNSFSGKLLTSFSSGMVSFDMDYRWFFQDHTVYQEDLSTVSLLFSSAIYHENLLFLRDSSGMDSYNGSSMEEILKYFGLQGVKICKLDKLYSDNHISEVGMGYRTVNYKGEDKTVLAVIVRGTNGTIEEWSSNFDIGNQEDFGKTADWKDKENHRGFDVAANRILRLTEQYISGNGLDASGLTYWVTGHSRGAAVANIIGARLEAESKRAFTYTFASPNTTLDKNASSYQSIFNIVNADDFVPCLPMAAWGYGRYGRTASESIAAKYEKEWEKMTGIWDYNPDTFGMQNTVSALADILSGNPETECYKYTCVCHGDSTDDRITIKNYGISEKSREEAIAKIPENALPYCVITRYQGGFISGWDFEVCQTPSYFMQILAAKMSGKISDYRFVVELDIAERYKRAKKAIIGSAIGGLEHPHYTESYYVLSKNLRAVEFR